MLHPSRGFTLIELLIIISVIGILATIGIIGLGNLPGTSRDKARAADVNQWMNTFDLYKSRYFVWPVLPVNDTTPTWVCLGSPEATVPNADKCVVTTGATQYNGTAGTYLSKTTGTQGTDYTALTTGVKKVGNLQTNTGPDVNGIYRGPFVYLSQTTTVVSSVTTVNVTGRFVNFFEKGCPDSTYTRITTATPPAPYSPLLTGIPSSIFVCEKQVSFSYQPS